MGTLPFKSVLIFTLSFGVLAALFIGNPKEISTVEQSAHAIVDLLVTGIIAGLFTSAIAAFYK
jgi:VIT1/CCC1 family predicted Fe2+/Mn2+ transporter